ncbi:MAG: methyltransferase domain-containing protein [Pseudomonadota bacterium]
MSGRRALQFSDDASTMREVFADFEVSTYGGENHLDLAAIDRPDASYTMVIANHVLEHVADDGKALRELARIAGPEGVIFLSVPDLLRVEKTIEYGRAREDKHGHYRLYGPDLMERVSRHAPTLSRLGLIPTDPVTGEPDRATLLCAHAGTLARAKDLLHEAGIQSFDA